jgi:hypothetical protein
MTLIQVDEYAVAIAVWVLLAAVLLSKAFHWRGVSGHPLRTRILKFLGMVGALAFLCFSVVWTQAKRGDKAWTSFGSRHVMTPDRPSLPGLSVQSVVALRRTGLDREQYIFDSGNLQRFSVYISPNETLTFAVIDRTGERHDVEAPLGSSGVPFDEWVFLVCEIGVGVDTSFMRILANNKEIAYREIPERIPLFPYTQSGGGTSIGGSLSNDPGAAFAIELLAIYGVTSTNDQLASNEKVIKGYKPNLYHLPPFKMGHPQ